MHTLMMEAPYLHPHLFLWQSLTEELKSSTQKVLHKGLTLTAWQCHDLNTQLPKQKALTSEAPLLMCRHRIYFLRIW